MNSILRPLTTLISEKDGRYKISLYILLGYMKKYIIEYCGGTKGDMLCRFLNNLPADQNSTGKSSHNRWPWDGSNWLKAPKINGVELDLTLDRFEEALWRNPYEFTVAHPLWIIDIKDYRDLLKEYNYEIYSIKFKPKHYATIRIESLIKNFHNREDWEKIDILNVLFFSLKLPPPEWLLDSDKKLMKTVFTETEAEKKTVQLLDLWARKWRPMASASDRYCPYTPSGLASFNEMTEHRTILNYEDLYLGGYPFPDLPDREKEWKDLVENSWCDYNGRGYRKFEEPKYVV